MDHSARLREAVIPLAEDYRPWGDVTRWEDPDKSYSDCSCGCIFYYELADKDREPLGADFGVCTNPKSHRCGLLTFEHQGCSHFKSEK